MSNMKCPFCQQELVGTIGHPICRNQNCIMCDDPMPQDLLEELIRTREALGVAVDGLEKMTWGCDSSDAEHLLKEIKEITETKEQNMKELNETKNITDKFVKKADDFIAKQKEPELLPCPFCGSKPCLLPDGTVECMGDDCPMHPDYIMPIEKWNNRK